jgi:hypothetical protein
MVDLRDPHAITALETGLSAILASQDARLPIGALRESAENVRVAVVPDHRPWILPSNEDLAVVWRALSDSSDPRAAEVLAAVCSELGTHRGIPGEDLARL